MFYLTDAISLEQFSVIDRNSKEQHKIFMLLFLLHDKQIDTDSFLETTTLQVQQVPFFILINSHAFMCVCKSHIVPLLDFFFFCVTLYKLLIIIRIKSKMDLQNRYNMKDCN